MSLPMNALKKGSSNQVPDNDNAIDILDIPYSNDDQDDDQSSAYSSDDDYDDDHQSIKDWTSSRSFYQPPYNVDDGAYVSQTYQSRPVPDSVLKGLLSEEKIITQGIQKLMAIHSEMSETGKSTKMLRNDLVQYFKSLGMLYQALSELYDKETLRNQLILSDFKQWNTAKREISDKIQMIRSDGNPEGRKLKLLEGELGVLNDEIHSLEERLRQLKEKRRTLKTEIVQSQSVIESRASTHLEELRSIEDTERRKIEELTEERSVSAAHQNSGSYGLASILNRFNSMGLTSERSISPETVMEIFSRQVESFKDRAKEYKSRELMFQETALVWESISDILEQLELDIQNVLSEPPEQKESRITKTKIINLLSQARVSLGELQESLKIEANSVVEKLFQSEVEIIQKSLCLLDPTRLPNRNSTKPTTIPELSAKHIPNEQHHPNYSINHKSITPTSLRSSPNSHIGLTTESSIPDVHPTLISSSGQITSSQSPPSIIGSELLKKNLKSQKTTRSNKKSD